jgi:DNA-binding PadR family transcriptional regulator
VHRELRQLEGEGLVEAVRTEKIGRRPERTLYRITGEGRRELSVLRRRVIADVDGSPDLLSVALVFAGTEAIWPGRTPRHDLAVLEEQQTWLQESATCTTTGVCCAWWG